MISLTHTHIESTTPMPEKQCNTAVKFHLANTVVNEVKD
jgi:hypothetical protein